MARPGRPERNRAARSFRQLRRFHRVINSDEVFGTHTGAFISPDLFAEGAGNGIPPAPKVELQDAGKIARLTVRLAALPPPDRPLTLTLIDDNRAAEFK